MAIGAGSASAQAVLPAPPASSSLDSARIDYLRLPLRFEANEGQVGEQSKFISRGHGYTLFLTPSSAVFEFAAPKNSSPAGARLDPSDPKSFPARSKAARWAVRVKLDGANQASKIVGLDELPGKSNYFIGSDPSRWRTDIPTYARVKYAAVYPGIDLLYYGHQQEIEEDFIVAPGADPRVIQMGFEGSGRLSIDERGDLVLTNHAGTVRLKKPAVYQEVNGVREAIPGGYLLKGGKQVGFEVARYDSTKPLVIDPILVYSSYLGGNGSDAGYGIAVDSTGSVYVTGSTASANFPASAGAFQTAFGGGVSNAFVTKFDPTGATLLYSTYLGGSGSDSATAIAVDSTGTAYVTGTTNSSDFPVTAGAFQTTLGRGAAQAFITKLNATGSGLDYSTFLGGRGQNVGEGIAIDSSGSAYVTGQTQSNTFPVTPGAFQTVGIGTETFVTKLNSTGTALTYSTYLGGSVHGQNGTGIAVDSSGSAYIVGWTNSPTFPTTPGAFQTTFLTRSAFVTKMSPDGSALVYSTYLGASGNVVDGFGIAIDSAGSAYVTGLAGSSNFPTTPGAFQTTGSGSGHAFVTKFDPTGSFLVYSTYLGGSNGDVGDAIAVDSSGAVYVTGSTSSTDFPTTPGAIESTLQGTASPFVTSLNPAGSALIYSTYLGGNTSDVGQAIAVDSSGAAYVTGSTQSNTFPTTPGAYQTILGGTQNAFVAKITANTAPGNNVAVPLQGGDATPGGGTLTFGNVVTNGETLLSTSGSAPAGPPAGFTIGSPAVYYSLTTTATYSGSITVCLNYMGVTFTGGPQLFHYEGGSWVNVTTSVDAVNDIVCGSVTSLSPFAIFQQLCTASPSLGVSLSPNALWPPNHKLVEITASISAQDPCDANPSVDLLSITANESLAPGDIAGAAYGTADFSFELAATRSGSGSGRIYTVTYQLTDRLDHTTTASGTVTVAHDQGNH